MLLDFQNKSRPLHTASVDKPKNATFLGINHGLISFEKEAYKGKAKPPPTRVTLLRPLQAGWVSAPYKQGQKLRGPKLSEMCAGGIRFFAYEKVTNNMEKGPRCDDISYELHPGDTLNLWIDEKRLDEVKRDLPEDILKIEPFTVCIVTISPKNSDGTAQGKGCKISAIRPCGFTLYSCMPDLEAFPLSLADARTQALKEQQARPFVTSDLNPAESLFHIYCDRKAYIHEHEELDDAMVTLVNTGIEPVDIPIKTLLQYTNCSRKDQACSLLELAIASSALQLLVFNSDYWKNATGSHLRAIPIIDTELLLQSITPALVGTQTCFNTEHTMMVDDINYQIQIHVDQEPTTVTKGPPPASPDFVLSSTQVELERAYKVRFALNHPPSGDEIPRYWVGYFDASARRSTPVVGFRKRKMTPADDE